MDVRIEARITLPFQHERYHLFNFRVKLIRTNAYSNMTITNSNQAIIYLKFKKSDTEYTYLYRKRYYLLTYHIVKLLTADQSWYSF